MVETASHEVAIAEFLRNERGADDHMLCILECDHVPFFAIVREFAEFVEQVLKMIPGGFHFQKPFTANDVDILRQYKDDDSEPHLIFNMQGLVPGEDGRMRKRVPEISRMIPYDPLKVDGMSDEDMARPVNKF
ncbi:hypothetical protein C8R44DRAFT_734990 [Mycena epipterygia]|nr:hypothetical protein C8R44DRAFT_734990 [Mycena epipterygia]